MAGDLTPLDFECEGGGPAEVVAREERRGHAFETWRITGSAGDVVYADAYLSPEAGPVVIGGHGKDDRRSVQYLRGPGTQWAGTGLSLVAADAPLHGDRAGELPVPRVTMADPALLVRWVKDQRRLVDAVEARFGAGVPIAYVGVSMGAVMGCHLVAAEPRISAAVLVVGGSTVVSVPERFPDAGDLALALAHTDPEIPAARISPRPVLMVNADDDEIFSRRSAMALYDALRPPKEITFFPGRHAVWRSPAQWNRRMLEFLKRALPPASPS